jgi:hypothetical protein
MTISLETAREQGLKLWDALEKYSDRAMWNEYEVARNHFFPKLPPEDLRPERIQWGAAPPLPTDPVQDFLKFQQLETRLKDNLLKLLTTEKLLATGYPSPRVRDQKPVWISPDRWKPDRVSWDESELWLPDEVFEEILVVPSSALRAAEAITEMPSLAPPRSPGRPSRKGEILAAYVALRENEKIDFGSLNQNIANIRETVIKLGQDPKNKQGLGDETIRITVHDHFYEDQKAYLASQKSSQKSSQKN